MKLHEVVIYASTYDRKNDDGKFVQGGEIHILSREKSVSNEKCVFNGHEIAQVEVTFEVVQKIIGQIPGL